MTINNLYMNYHYYHLILD